MNNLQDITFRHTSVAVRIARYNFTVSLHDDPRRPYLQLVEQRAETQSGFDLFILAVNFYSHDPKKNRTHNGHP